MEKKLIKSCTIYLVRHGQTDWNAKGIIQGIKDIPINKTGKEQAKKTSRELKNIKFSAIYSSNLSRAKQTAEIIALEHKLAVKTHKALRERSFGKYAGMKSNQFRKALKELLSQTSKLSYKEKSKFDFGGGIEKIHDATSRFITFLREISIAHPGQKILVVTHGGLMRHLLIHLGFGEEHQLPWNSLGNTACIKLESDGVDFFVKETYGVTINEN